MAKPWRPTRLTGEQLQQRRLAAVRRWRQCKGSQAQLAREMGVSRSSVSRWLKRFRHGGRRALRARAHTGRAARLTRRQWQRLGWMLDRGARAAGFVNERWTLKRIATLIEREFGVRYHPRHLARPLKAHGFTVQLPLPRARERDELLIARWPHEEWVELKKKRAGSIARLSSWTRRGTASSRARATPGRAAPSARSSSASPSAVWSPVSWSLPPKGGSRPGISVVLSTASASSVH